MALNDAIAPTSKWRSTAIPVALREANIQHVDVTVHGITRRVPVGQAAFIEADSECTIELGPDGVAFKHSCPDPLTASQRLASPRDSPRVGVVVQLLGAPE